MRDSRSSRSWRSWSESRSRWLSSDCTSASWRWRRSSPARRNSRRDSPSTRAIPRASWSSSTAKRPPVRRASTRLAAVWSSTSMASAGALTESGGQQRVGAALGHLGQRLLERRIAGEADRDVDLAAAQQSRDLGIERLGGALHGEPDRGALVAGGGDRRPGTRSAAGSTSGPARGWRGEEGSGSRHGRTRLAPRGARGEPALPHSW